MTGRWEREKADGTASAVGFGSSRACKCRWAPYVRDHDPGQGQLPVSTIKAPGHRIPDARSRTRPITKLGSHAELRNAPAGAMHEVSIALAPFSERPGRTQHCPVVRHRSDS